MKKTQKKKLHIYKLKKNLKDYKSWIVVSPAIVTKWQIDAVKIFLKLFKDNGAYKKKIQFFKFSTKKARGLRMGKGAGAFSEERYHLRSNTKLFTIFSNLEFEAKQQITQMLSRVSAPSFVHSSLLIDSKYET